MPEAAFEPTPGRFKNLLRRGNLKLQRRQGFERKEPPDEDIGASSKNRLQRADSQGFFWKDVGQGKKSLGTGLVAEETVQHDLHLKVPTTPMTRMNEKNKEKGAIKNASIGQARVLEELSYDQAHPSPGKPLPARLTERLYPNTHKASASSQPPRFEHRTRPTSTNDLRMQVEYKRRTGMVHGKHELPNLEIVYVNRKSQSRTDLRRSPSLDRLMRPQSSKEGLVQHGRLTHLGPQTPTNLPTELFLPLQRLRSGRNDGASQRMSVGEQHREEVERAKDLIRHSEPNSRAQTKAKQTLFELENARFDRLPIDEDEFRR